MDERKAVKRGLFIQNKIPKHSTLNLEEDVVGNNAGTQYRRPGRRQFFLRPRRLLASIANAVGMKEHAAMTSSQSSKYESNRRANRKNPSKVGVGKNEGRGDSSLDTLAIVAKIPKPAYFFGAGAIAGAIGKTVTAPLDRIKILLQVKGGFSGSEVVQATASGGFLPAVRAIFKEEGLKAFWKGNLPQVLRVLPYSALQLYSYEELKKVLITDKEDKMIVAKRLIAGASAGMIATVSTYPLDTLRLRMAVDSSIKTMPQAFKILFKEGGMSAFYRGCGPAMIGVAPYMALELASFDFLKKVIKNDHNSSATTSFVSGFVAALMASSVTYPLDTVRRQIQFQGGSMLTLPSMCRNIFVNEGMLGFYRGFVPSLLKNLPNKGIRLATFDTAKQVMSRAQEREEAEKLKGKSRRRKN